MLAYMFELVRLNDWTGGTSDPLEKPRKKELYMVWNVFWRRVMLLREMVGFELVESMLVKRSPLQKRLDWSVRLLS